MRALKIAAAAIAAMAVMALFFGWCSWWESPAGWREESRFMVGFVTLAAGAIAAMVAHDVTEET